MEFLSDLKKLINGELVAAIQYKIIADGITGSENFDYIKSHCSEHYEEEMGHYTSLVTALMARGESPEMNLSKIISDATPSTTELSSFDVDAAKKFFIDAENSAVEAYLDFHKKIEEVDPDLDDLIVGIIADEREHSLDMSRLDGTSEQPIEEIEKEESDTEEKTSEEVEDNEEKDDESEDEKEEKEIKPFGESRKKKTGYELLEERLHKKSSYSDSFKKFIDKLDN